jgi:hypothetical protein
MRRACRAVLTSAVLAACATIPPPATRSPASPAHPEAPEAATPPLAPMLTGSEPVPAPSATPDPRSDSGNSGSEGASPASVWTCSMHPQVEAAGPGACPVCGMPLARRDVSGGSPR